MTSANVCRTLSETQQRAVDSVMEWLNGDRSNKPMFRLFGYAGTGKTTIAKEIADRARKSMNRDVVFMAYTGKAAGVLRKKGCAPASTIHKAIYTPVGDDDQDAGDLKWMLTGQGIIGCGLVIIDECSMVGDDLGRDLLSFGVPVLVLGDPGQLPPIGGAGFFVAQGTKPDVMLTEIHRQAGGSGIIEIATAARTRAILERRKYLSDAEVIDMKAMSGIDPLSYDQVIVGKNLTRKLWNARMRAKLGRMQWHPVAEDKLVCLRNHKGFGVSNGELLQVIECVPGDPTDQEEKMRVHLKTEEGREIKGKALKHCFVGSDEDPPWKGNDLLLDFGYAITAHKSQGSEWGRVLVIDESSVFRESRHQWLYTACTRASDFLTVVR